MMVRRRINGEVGIFRAKPARNILLFNAIIILDESWRSARSSIVEEGMSYDDRS
jgi:hypothetical protein